MSRNAATPPAASTTALTGKACASGSGAVKPDVHQGQQDLLDEVVLLGLARRLAAQQGAHEQVSQGQPDDSGPTGRVHLLAPRHARAHTSAPSCRLRSRICASTTCRRTVSARIASTRLTSDGPPSVLVKVCAISRQSTAGRRARCPCPAAQRTGSSLAPQGVGHQLGLARPLAVHRGLRRAGPGGDRVHGDPLVPDLGDQLRSSGQDRLLPCRTVRTRPGPGLRRPGLGDCGGVDLAHKKTVPYSFFLSM